MISRLPVLPNKSLPVFLLFLKYEEAVYSSFQYWNVDLNKKIGEDFGVMQFIKFLLHLKFQVDGNYISTYVGAKIKQKETKASRTFDRLVKHLPKV